jgi:thiol:disulfide interchange protein
MKPPRSILALAIANLALVAVMFTLAIHGCHRRVEAADVVVHSTTADNALDVAVSVARQRNLPCYVLVGAPWCGPCRIVERDCLATMQATGVYVHLNADVHREPLRRLVKAIGREVVSLPTLVIIDAVKGTKRVLVGPKEIKAYLGVK